MALAASIHVVKNLYSGIHICILTAVSVYVFV